MRLYHGSNIENLNELKPHISEHKKSYIYFTTNKIIAAFYTVHCVERPYNWFPYGFNKSETPVYIEYYPNAMADVYKGKNGFIYECSNISNINNLTNIPGSYVNENTVMPEYCTRLNDVYEWLLEHERSGKLIIQRYDTLSKIQKSYSEEMLTKEIKDYKLHEIPNCSYSQFIMKRFPDVWNCTK